MIISYKQINKLVAESLGWLEQEFQGYTFAEYPGLSSIKYLCPDNLADENERLEYYRRYEYCPDFALNWEHTGFILEECDRQDLILDVQRSKEVITCSIKSINPTDWVAKDFKPVTVGLEMPRLMSLAVALAWLNFKGFKFEKKLQIILEKT